MRVVVDRHKIETVASVIPCYRLRSSIPATGIVNIKPKTRAAILVIEKSFTCRTRVPGYLKHVQVQVAWKVSPVHDQPHLSVRIEDRGERDGDRLTAWLL